ncbi:MULTISPECIES: hypothetical protein [unclassified Blastococcus]
MQHAPVPPPGPAPDRSAGTTAFLALLWAGWVLVPVGLAVAALGNLLTFFGEQPTEAEQADARRLFVLAAGVAVAIPLVGLVASLRAQRRGSAVAFGCALAVAGVVALAVAVAAARAAPDEVAPREPGGCQEHSGGDTRCPGG